MLGMVGGGPLKWPTNRCCYWITQESLGFFSRCRLQDLAVNQRSKEKVCLRDNVEI